jgi:hypothetical protein
MDCVIVQRVKSDLKGKDALSILIDRWKDNPLVIGCAHANDRTASKVICDAGFNRREFLDSNLISSHFDRFSQGIALKHLRGLQMKIKTRFNDVVRRDERKEDRMRYWRNTVQHFADNQENCSGFPASLRLQTSRNGNEKRSNILFSPLSETFSVRGFLI